MDNGMDAANIGASLGRQIMGTIGAREDGYGKMAKLLAETNMRQAQGDFYKQKANSERQRAQYQTPEYASKIAASLAGLSDPQAGEMEAFAKNGNWGVTPGYSLPAELSGPTTPDAPKAAPEWATPQVKDRYNAGRTAQMLNLAGTGDSKADDLQKAIAGILGQGRIDSAMADPSKAPVLGQAMAASEGKPLYHAGPNGTMQLFTGQENLNDVGRSAARENLAQANNANAAAGNQSASAALHRAQIPEVQSRIALNNSKSGQPTLNPDGSITGPGAKINWKYDAGSDEFVAAPTPEFPNGQRSGNIAKLNAGNALDYVISQFDADVEGKSAEKGKSLLDTTPQGGVFGVSGYLGKATDSQKGKRFDNLREQLSTELRTLFRIPGEGALSDREQAQYGVQLPSVTNDKSTNVAILRDIKARTGLRMDQGSNPMRPHGSVKPLSPATAPRGSVDRMTAMSEAKAAIAAGAPRAAVIQRLREMGIKDGAL